MPIKYDVHSMSISKWSLVGQKIVLEPLGNSVSRGAESPSGNSVSRGAE